MEGIQKFSCIDGRYHIFWYRRNQYHPGILLPGWLFLHHCMKIGDLGEYYSAATFCFNMKWGYFKRSWIMLKVMPWPWLSFSKQIWIRSFKWGTVRSCRSRGWKNIRGQSWRSIRNCRLGQIRDRCARGPAALADFFRPPTLTSDIFAASWPTRTYSTSFERSDSYLFGEWKPRPWHDF